MPESKPKVTLPLVLQAGGGLIVDAKGYTANQLEELAREAAAGTSLLILKGSGKFPTDVLTRIAREGRGRVIFDLT